MNTGTVKFFDEEKGYGFITPENGDKDLFVHKTNVDGDINQWDTVEFTIGESNRWPQAENVVVIS